MLTRKEIREYVRSSLGIDIVNVELEDKHVDAAIAEATGLVNAYVPQRKWTLIPGNINGDPNAFTVSVETARGGKYLYSPEPIPDPAGGVTAEFTARKDTVRVIPGIQRVASIVPIRDTVVGADQIDLFDPLIYVAGGIQNANGLASYQLAVSYLKTAKRILSSEHEWRWMWSYDTVLQYRIGELYFMVPRYSRYSYGVEFIVSIQPDDSLQNGIGYISDGLHDWFKRYVLAKCQHILGRALGKFGGVPGSEGNILETDSNRLREEGREDMRELREEIIRMKPTLPPLLA